MSEARAFDGLATPYHSCRPRYPRSVFEALRDFAARGRTIDERAVLVDVGAGSGIATRMLRDTFGPGPLVVAVEPSRDMRRAGSADTSRGDAHYVGGVAERLPLRDRCVALALVAQSLQWFDRPRFYAEARRVLAPGATLAVVQNNRDWATGAAARAFEEFLEEHSPGYSRTYRAFDVCAELERTGYLTVAEPARESWTRRMTLGEFLQMTTSSTKMQAAMRALGDDRALETLRERVEPCIEDGAISIPYVSELYMARVRDDTGGRSE